ncbi:hypothetical protein HDE_09213 [Halotydeus destructor]|nr:hypothetical protein HDE_09213 [Halotydeus destructor]
MTLILRSQPSNMATKVAEGRERDANGQSFFDYCVLGLDHLNCTIVYMDSMLTGTADENGTFNGTIGYMQRDVSFKTEYSPPFLFLSLQEIDYGFPAIRIDTLDHDIVRIGPVLSPADTIIISMPKSAEKMNLDLCDVLDTMTSTFKAYLLLITAIVVMVLFVLECHFKISERTRTLEVYWPDMYKIKNIVWEVLELFVDQEYYETNGKCALRMLWSIFALSVYVVVYCYLVNYMSVNEVASKPLDTIDSIEAHLSGRFNHVEPIIMENSVSYPLLAAANATSSLGRLYHKAEVNRKDNIVDMGSAENDVMSGVFERVFKSEDKASLIMERFLWDTSTRGIMCAVGTEHVAQVHESRDSFANGVMASFFNKRSPPGFTRYAEYRFRILAESFLSQQAFRHMSEIMVISTIGSIPFDVLQCWNKDKMAEMDESVTPTSLKVMRNTIEVYLKTLSLAVLVLALERALAFARKHKLLPAARDVVSLGSLFAQ